MRTRPSLGKVLVCGFFVFGVSIGYPQQASVAVGPILAQLEGNTEQYMASVPNFICDERITSQEIHDDKIKRQINVEALFRVSRSSRQAGVLEETREVRVVDGRPSDGKKLRMPLAFSGGFSGVLMKFLSASHQQCLSYRQESSSPGSLAFSFVANDGNLEEPSCRSIQRGTSGKVSVDSAAMQVTHIERTVPFPIGKDQSVLSTAAVDFAPAAFNDTIFWLPVTVTAFTTETAKTNGVRFTARYSNYHQFGATSKIIP